ncbi:MAG: hypothetical protein N0A00_00095 [Candidatus Bathyarchaeota archaeon]|nr:hypothetical protein [Candidatus Bathyarchaeota archaeon]
MFFDKHFNRLFKRICEFAEEKSQEKFVENMTETLDYILVQTLVKLVTENGYYKVKIIKEAMASNFDEPQKWLTTKWVGNALRRLGFTEKRRFGSGYEYFLSKDKVADLAERLGVSISESPSSSKFTYSVSSQNPPSPSIPDVYKTLREDFRSCEKCNGRATTRLYRDGREVWLCGHCLEKWEGPL